MIEQLLSPELVHAIGWSLVHSLWQAAVFALALGLTLLALRTYSARARYYVSIAMLGGLFLTVGLTFAGLYQATGGSPTLVSEASQSLSAATGLETGFRPESVPGAAAANAAEGTGSTGFLATMSRYYNEHLPLFVTVWLLGVLVLQLRFVGQLVYLQRLKNYGADAFPAKFSSLLRELEEAMGLKKAVRYLTSFRVASPFTMGWLQPVVMFPTTLLEQLREPELRTILAHELAHVKRHDFLVNLGQTLFCILFFYHPAVWWMSARIEDEREHCCDDLAIAVTGERIGYAKTLIQLKEAENSPRLAMALRGRGGFQGRVKRLLSGVLGTGTYGEGFTSAVIIFGIMAVAVTLTGRENGALSSEVFPRTDNVISTTVSGDGVSRARQLSASLMLKAVESNDLYLVQNLIDQGADVNADYAPNAATYTPLMVAAGEGHLEISELLIEKGADVNAIHEGGWTPLMYAASEDHVGVAQILIEAGADVNKVNRNGWTALVEAADENALAVAELLLASGARVDVPGTPQSALSMAASEGHTDMIVLLVGAGAKINTPQNGYTPLHAASEENHLSIVKAIVAKGADVNARDLGGRTPLHLAAEEGNFRVVEFLLAQGAKYDAMDNGGRTPLGYAAEEGNGRIVELLLAKQ